MDKFTKTYLKILGALGKKTITEAVDDSETSEGEIVDNFKVEAEFTEKQYIDGEYYPIRGAKIVKKTFDSLEAFLEEVKDYLGYGDILELTFEIEGYGADMSADMEQAISESDYTYENLLKYFDYCIENDDNASMCVRDYAEDDEIIKYVSFFVTR